MIPASFEYHAPMTVGEALELLARHGDEGKILAGGHSLLPMMKLRFAQPAHVIDINRIDELRGIRVKKNVLHIGAMTTKSQLIASELVTKECPLLPCAARQIADPQLRNRGTIGGNVAHGDPGNDLPAVMLALGASLVLRSAGGERVLPADGFYLGSYVTKLEPAELVTEIRVPIPQRPAGHSYQKLKRKTGDYATAGAAVQLSVKRGLKRGACRHIGIALTNVAPTAIKLTGAEGLLLGQDIDDELIDKAAELAMEACEPAEDLRGPVEYKVRMAGEMTRRALAEALARARSG